MKKKHIMKTINIVLTVLLFGAVIISCGDQPEKKKSSAIEINDVKKKENKEESRSNNKVASAEVEVEETSGETAIPDEQLAVAKKLISSTDKDLVRAVDAKKIFKNYCAICHGRKGNMEINGSKDLSKTSTSVTERVAQVYFGKGTMTPFKGVLKDEEIIAVAGYIDQLKK